MKYVPKAITRAVGRTVLKSQKNAPTLLFVAGVTGAVTATVLACRATLKTQPVLDDWKKDLIDLETHASRNRVAEDQYRKDLAYMHFRYIGRITKLYGPSVVLGVVSISCLTKSHNLLKERNAALTATVVGLQNFLESYRGRVREEVGEEREKNIYYSSTPVELIEDTPNGPKKIYGSAPGAPSPYSVIWDETSGVWQDSDEYNRHLVRLQEGLLTDKLRAQGYLFLNDVYKVFDIPVTQTGQLCGWMIPHPKSDDFVEITITPMHDFHRSLMLDFNVAGVVYDMLDDNQMSR